MSEPTLITVAYEATPSLTFDMEYYLTKHMPAVEERWKEYGLQSCIVADLRGSGGPFAVQAMMLFSTGVQGFQSAFEQSPDLIADIKAYTNHPPLRLIGPVIRNTVFSRTKED